jgi:hypothetical protein
MGKESKKSPETAESVSLIVQLSTALDPATEKKVRHAIARADGTEPDSLHVTERTLSLCYDPVRINKDKLTELLDEAGVQRGEIRTEYNPLV